MDQLFKKVFHMDTLKLKTGINIYRLSFMLLLVPVMACLVCFLRDQNFWGGIISITAFVLTCLAIIFMDKIVYWFRLPTNYLLISSEEIIYQKKTDKYIFPISEAEICFHPFYQGFESVSLLSISVRGKETVYVSITKKQYELIQLFLTRN